ncbi:MAG: hypothetical protein WD830_02935 [Chloroflexota bacterium]
MNGARCPAVHTPGEALGIGVRGVSEVDDRVVAGLARAIAGLE